MSEPDQGDIPPELKQPENSIRISIINGQIVMQFAKETTALMLAPLEAMLIANHLLGTAIRVMQEPPRIIRPN